MPFSHPRPRTLWTLALLAPVYRAQLGRFWQIGYSIVFWPVFTGRNILFHLSQKSTRKFHTNGKRSSTSRRTFFFSPHVCSSKQANWHVVILTFTSGLANFLALEVITMNDWYTSSSLNLSWKQPKFSCNFRMPFSLYGSTDKQKATSFHCRSVLSGKERVQFTDVSSSPVWQRFFKY